MLTDSNFDQQIYGSKDIWLVEFYAPWCGHCKALEPEWNQAAADLKGKVKFGKVDATAETGLAQKFGVQGYPTIKYFDYGSKASPRDAKPYEMGRTAADLKNFASDLLDRADIEPDLWELTNQKVYDEHCKGTTICILSFLPNIYESSALERNQYLEMIMKVAKSNRKQPFTFFWLQAGDQLDLERSLNLGFGFPAMIAVSPNKSVFATMTAAFDKEHASSFLNSVMSGRARTDSLPKSGMVFKKRSKWDGKDAEPIVDDWDEL